MQEHEVFFMMFTGDWGLATPQHYCNSTCGCGGWMEVVIEKMFAAALRVNLLVGKLVEPSVDDWGSCGDAAGRAALGCLVHNLLPLCRG